MLAHLEIHTVAWVVSWSTKEGPRQPASGLIKAQSTTPLRPHYASQGVYFGPALNIPRSHVPYSLFLSHTTYRWCHLQGWYQSYDRSIPLSVASAHIAPSNPQSARIARSSRRNILVYSSLHRPIWKLKAFLATSLLRFFRHIDL